MELNVGDVAEKGGADLRDLASRFSRSGRVEAMYLRPQRRGEVQPVEHALVIAASMPVLWWAA